jgi:hypothetical protein
MSRGDVNSGVYLRGIDGADEKPPSLNRIMGALNVHTGRDGLEYGSLPFAPKDTTAGSEAELQAAVIGQKTNVDLPLMIEQSNYYANILRRAAAGDTAKRVITDLEKFLHTNQDQVWENSWVRLPLSALNAFAEETFRKDLLASKEDPAQGERTDAAKFMFRRQDREFIRVPISYLLKLALADVLGAEANLPAAISQSGRDMMGHFLNDNTSPETFSFYVTPLETEEGMGQPLAREMGKRFLLTQLLTMYANEKFYLTSTGQKAAIFYSPHPPVRQQKLNQCVSDAFYRELFMSPCLSGWNRGEVKQDYMHLCHRVLSRSQLNTLIKLREAGIITSNLVALPNTSNVSLANNGTHISLGSRKLTEAMKDPACGFTRASEKYLGDLVVKTVEHFLPLFVGSYSAAPYRLDYLDFHPEKVLGFLPHELDYTHLRMIWRRWRKKANIKIMGRPVTPFGPLWLDRMVKTAFDLKGDFVPDFRLIDYLVALMSTERSPALDGHLHNSERLKADLADLGVFDQKMSLYLFEKLREQDVMGFSGFEARHYSLFCRFEEDMGRAAAMQNLLYCLAFQYIAQGLITHDHIPDTPVAESERRQIIFGAAIGVPTFFVHQDTPNLLLRRIITGTSRNRHSRRYPGYIRVHNAEYRRALLRILREDAAELIEMFNMTEIIDDLSMRLEDPDHFAVAGRLSQAICAEANVSSPMKAEAADFNRAAEKYYRETLRVNHIQESLQFFEEDLLELHRLDGQNAQTIRHALHFVFQDRDDRQFIAGLRKSIAEETVTEEDLRKLIYLMIITIYEEKTKNDHAKKPSNSGTLHIASLC